MSISTSDLLPITEVQTMTDTKLDIQIFEQSPFHAVSGRQSIRDYNQDYFLCRPTIPCTCLAIKESPHTSAIYIVSDGHGESGKQAAEKSANIMESMWLNEFLPTFDANDTKCTMNALVALFQRTDERLAPEINPQGGTTCTFAFIHGNKILYMGNVGDSSAKIYKRQIRNADHELIETDDDDLSNSWMLDDGIGAKPELITRRSLVSIEMSTDHKPQDAHEKERIEQLGGTVFQNNGIRVEGVLNMSRALGNQGLKPFVSCEPTVRAMPLEGNINTIETILILASDGLWGFCEESRVLSAVNRACKLASRNKNAHVMDVSTPANQFEGKLENPEDKPRKIVQELGELAKRHKSSDNLTIIAVMLDVYVNARK